MQYDANSPIWLQVMNLIRMDIVTGKRAPGEKLPGGRDLAVQFSINPNTAARVYRELESDLKVCSLLPSGFQRRFQLWYIFCNRLINVKEIDDPVLMCCDIAETAY